MLTQSDRITQGVNVIRSIRRMSGWLLAWGVFNMIVPSFDSAFGLVLIITGLVNHVFGVPAVLLIQVILFVYAAVFNLIVGVSIAYTFSILLALSIVQMIRLYRQACSLELDPSISSSSSFTISSLGAAEAKAARFFPLGAFLGAAGSWLGFIAAAVLGYIVIGPSIEFETPWLFDFAIGFFIELGVLAFALGLASLISGYRYKLLSIMAVLAGSGNLAFIFLAETLLE